MLAALLLSAVTIVLPHPLREGDTATLVVTLGVLPKNAEVDIATTKGLHLGTLSPYGIRPGAEAGAYAVPLPSDAFVSRHIALVLTVHFAGKEHAATPREVKRIRVNVRRGG